MPASPLRAVAAPGPVRAGSRRRIWPLVAAGLFLLAMVVVARFVDVGSHLEAAQGWTATLGGLAPAVFVLVYVAATLIGVPGMPFTLLSPFLFGIGPAFVVMVVGSAISAALGFLIARYLARDALAERLAEHRRLRASLRPGGGARLGRDPGAAHPARSRPSRS